MYTSIELFAGAGGLALGVEKAGFDTIGLIEFDKDAADTLKKNRPNWNVIHDDIANISSQDLEEYFEIPSDIVPFEERNTDTVDQRNCNKAEQQNNCRYCQHQVLAMFTSHIALLTFKTTDFRFLQKVGQKKLLPHK